jgi:hypothetical protein
MDIHIKIDELKVILLRNQSGIFSGENYHDHWSTMSKINGGLTLAGEHNCSRDSLNMVKDPDLVEIVRSPGVENLVREKKNRYR